MTTHGWGGPKRLWLGSVADEFLRRVRSPVLLLRRDRIRQAVAYHRVLVALDGNPGCEAVMESAIAIAELFPGAHYTLVQVVEPLPPAMLRMLGSSVRTGPALVEHHRAEVSGRLEELGRGLRRRGFAAGVRALVGPGTADQILDYSRHSGSDLLVIGTRAPHEVERLVLGSVADKIVRGASQPVLVVPLEPTTSDTLEPRHPMAALSRSGRAS